MLKSGKIFILFLLFILIPLLLYGDPWEGRRSNHPVTSDVLTGPQKGYLFSRQKLFLFGKGGKRSLYPFDMILNFYKNHITTLNGVSCRYYPTCSRYAQDAMSQYGILFGVVMGAERLMRCHEYQTDDLYDPVYPW